jgi:hypothetical protein
VQTSQKGQTSALVNDASERNSNRSQVSAYTTSSSRPFLTTRAGHAITNGLRQEIVSTPFCRHVAVIAIAHRSSAHYLHNDPVTELLEQLEFLRNRIFVDDYDDDDEDDDSLPMTHAFGLSSTSRSVNGLYSLRGGAFTTCARLPWRRRHPQQQTAPPHEDQQSTYNQQQEGFLSLCSGTTTRGDPWLPMIGKRCSGASPPAVVLLRCCCCCCCRVATHRPPNVLSSIGCLGHVTW